MEVMPFFASRLKDLREKEGLTQAQLGEKLGVSRGSIGYYEKQERVPDIEFLYATSTFFKVTPEYLLGMENGKTHETSSAQDVTGLSEQAILGLRKLAHDDGPRWPYSNTGSHLGDNAGLYLELQPLCQEIQIPRRVNILNLFDYLLSHEMIPSMLSALVMSINSMYLNKASRSPSNIDEVEAAPGLSAARSQVENQSDLSQWRAEKRALGWLNKASSSILRDGENVISFYGVNAAKNDVDMKDHLIKYSAFAKKYNPLFFPVMHGFSAGDEGLKRKFVNRNNEWLLLMAQGNAVKEDYFQWLRRVEEKKVL